MGAGYIFKCDHCDYSFFTTGPWEFYRDFKGNRHPYGHPSPFSEEAAKQGIAGLFCCVYCPNCDGTKELIIVEYKKPSKNSLMVWSGRCEPKEEYKEAGAVKCPTCGNTKLILGPEEIKSIDCPRCKKGKMIGQMTMIS